jgi:hypothetical protein
MTQMATKAAASRFGWRTSESRSLMVASRPTASTSAAKLPETASERSSFSMMLSLETRRRDQGPG